MYNYSMELRQGILLTGGLTSQTVFPRTEAKLEKSIYQEGLEYVASRKRMERYYSMMDFLFCESFPEWRFICFQYYNGIGPPLIDTSNVSTSMLKSYDVMLCDGMLELCKIAVKQKKKLAWRHVYESFHELLRAA